MNKARAAWGPLDATREQLPRPRCHEGEELSTERRRRALAGTLRGSRVSRSPRAEHGVGGAWAPPSFRLLHTHHTMARRRLNLALTRCDLARAPPEEGQLPIWSHTYAQGHGYADIERV